MKVSLHTLSSACTVLVISTLFLSLPESALASGYSHSAAMARAEAGGVVNMDEILSPAEIEAETMTDYMIDENELFYDLITPSSSRNGHEKWRKYLTEELLSYFDMVLYVNKAAAGATKQTMTVMTKERGQWLESARWLVSTGREKQEKYFTATPVGLAKIDPKRRYTMVKSRTWDNAPMPFAQFFDVSFTTRKTGIAIHAASSASYEKYLGNRASGGCIRLAMKNAEALFNMIGNDFQGKVPKFAWDKKEKRTSRYGVIERQANGSPVMVDGYKVLVVIVDAID